LPVYHLEKQQRRHTQGDGKGKNRGKKAAEIAGKPRREKRTLTLQRANQGDGGTSEEAVHEHDVESEREKE
jgi:hypothetical protein